jgi:hypothetical protein
VDGQRPGRFNPRKDPVPNVQEAGWASGPVWTNAENLAHTGIRSPERPARSESLYRLNYPGPKLTVSVCLIPYILRYCCDQALIFIDKCLNPLNALLNPICHLLALLGAHPILHVSRIRVKETVFMSQKTNWGPITKSSHLITWSKTDIQSQSPTKHQSSMCDKFQLSWILKQVVLTKTTGS